MKSSRRFGTAMGLHSMLLGLGCSLVAGVAAAAPNKNDYAQGMIVIAPNTQPMIETTLPDEVYRTVTREDLGDLRVFNADGMPVPHAFCTAPARNKPQITEATLPVFVLRGREQVYMDGSRVAVETSSGTRVDVQDSTSPSDQIVDGLVHIIDARGDGGKLRAIRFQWQSPDDVSEVKVRIEASENLDRWQVIVPASTLLIAGQGEQQLRRERIELPEREYEYLRVQRVDGGPPLTLNAVIAERVGAAEEVEPVWFNAARLPSQQPEELLFDAGHVAPVTYARLRLPQDNSSVGVSIESRSGDQDSWRPRWSGESYVIVTNAERRESPPARFDATADRHWRVRILKDPQVYQYSVLELGYRPARLRFLAQGDGPFTVAFGSRQADAVHPVACDGLLADVSTADRDKMIETGVVSAVQTLGGEAALKPAPKKTSFKVVVLWAVLLVGVALLVAMALSLLKRVRKPAP